MRNSLIVTVFTKTVMTAGSLVRYVGESALVRLPLPLSSCAITQNVTWPVVVSVPSGRIPSAAHVSVPTFESVMFASLLKAPLHFRTAVPVPSKPEPVSYK